MRGAVGVGTPDRWHGVYNHHDSQPEGLGPAVWLVVQEASRTERGLDELYGKLISAGDWRAFSEGEIAAEPYEMTHESADPLHIEWLYLVDVAQRKLHVVGHAMVETAAPSTPAYLYDLAGSFELDGPEPDWATCAKQHRRKHAPAFLAYIRLRFGDEAHDGARREIFGD